MIFFWKISMNINKQNFFNGIETYFAGSVYFLFEVHFTVFKYLLCIRLKTFKLQSNQPCNQNCFTEINSHTVKHRSIADQTPLVLTVNSLYLLKDCHSQCQRCVADLQNNGNVCLWCKDPRGLLLGEQCVPECPSGYYTDRGACKSKYHNGFCTWLYSTSSLDY